MSRFPARRQRVLEQGAEGEEEAQVGFAQVPQAEVIRTQSNPRGTVVDDASGGDLGDGGQSAVDGLRAADADHR